jgi:hypothetical protein
MISSKNRGTSIVDVGAPLVSAIEVMGHRHQICHARMPIRHKSVPLCGYVTPPRIAYPQVVESRAERYTS